MRRFRGALLDVDGTLIDSVEAHAQAWRDALAEAGHEVRTLQLKALIGMGGDQLLQQLIGREDKKLSKRRDEIFRERYLPRVRPVVGSRTFVLRLLAEGYHVVVASSSNPTDLKKLLQIADVEDLLEQRVSAGEVKHSKPSPDIIDAALAKIPVERHHAVMIGDAPYDIEAANNASVATIGVGTGGFPDLAGAIAIYRSVGELVALWDRSPLA